jgi:hypothetical protein
MEKYMAAEKKSNRDREMACQLSVNRTRIMGNSPTMPSLASTGLSLRVSLFERLLAAIDGMTERLGRTPQIPAHLALGIRGEEAAFFYLQRQGYVITARSLRSHR